jgi:hypothetical protein
MRRISVLAVWTKDDPEGQARLAAFQQGLQKSGWTVDQDVRLDYRWSASNGANFANTRPNWSRSRQTSSWPLAPRPWGRC